MKILYLTYSPAPYRVAFFNRLSRHCDLTVIYEKEPSQVHNRFPEWFREETETYHTCSLKDALYLSVRNYDLAVVCGYSRPAEIAALILLRFFHIPVMTEADGCLMHEHDPVWKRLIKRSLLSGVKGFLVSGQETKKYLFRYVPEGRPFYVYPFTTLTQDDLKMLESFDREALRRQLHMEGLCIFSAGQQIRRKGFDLLTEAISELPDMHLYLAGGTVHRDYGRIHECGFLSHREILQYLCACDLFVHPARQEVWGLCVAEALGAGKPVITTYTCTAGRELIRDHENGILIHADRRELVRALSEMRDPDLRNRLAKQAYLDMRNYTVEQMASAHCEAFEDVIQIPVGQE